MIQYSRYIDGYDAETHSNQAYLVRQFIYSDEAMDICPKVLRQMRLDLTDLEKFALAFGCVAMSDAERLEAEACAANRARFCIP